MNNILPKSQLSTIILSTMLNEDKYGLEIIKIIREKTNGEIEIKQPSLYSALNRLEKQGFVSSYWKESELGGKRHYYRITDLGKKQFDMLEESFYTSQENLINVLENTSPTVEKKYEPENNVQIQSINSNNFTNKSFANSFEEDVENTKQNEIILEVEEDILPSPNIIENTQEKSIEPELPKNEIKEKKDDGVFIQDRIPPELRPKAKKIETKYLDKINALNHENTLNLQEPKPVVNKIDALYQKSQINKLDKDYSYAKLEEEYKSIGVNFNSYNSLSNINNYKPKDKTNFFAKKGLILFIIILLESILTYVLCSSLNMKVDYIYVYFIVPALAALLPILLPKIQTNAQDFKPKHFAFDVMIFCIGLILIYSINMLIGLDFNNIVNYATTFIYPTVLLTNILISGLMNIYYCNKK